MAKRTVQEAYQNYIQQIEHATKRKCKEPRCRGRANDVAMRNGTLSRTSFQQKNCPDIQKVEGLDSPTRSFLQSYHTRTDASGRQHRTCLCKAFAGYKTEKFVSRVGGKVSKRKVPVRCTNPASAGDFCHMHDTNTKRLMASGHNSIFTEQRQQRTQKDNPLRGVQGCYVKRVGDNNIPVIVCYSKHARNIRIHAKGQIDEMVRQHFTEIKKLYDKWDTERRLFFNTKKQKLISQHQAVLEQKIKDIRVKYKQKCDKKLRKLTARYETASKDLSEGVIYALKNLEKVSKVGQEDIKVHNENIARLLGYLRQADPLKYNELIMQSTYMSNVAATYSKIVHQLAISVSQMQGSNVAGVGSRPSGAVDDTRKLKADLTAARQQYDAANRLAKQATHEYDKLRETYNRFTEQAKSFSDHVYSLMHRIAYESTTIGASDVMFAGIIGTLPSKDLVYQNSFRAVLQEFVQKTNSLIERSKSTTQQGLIKIQSDLAAERAAHESTKGELNKLRALYAAHTAAGTTTQQAEAMTREQTALIAEIGKLKTQLNERDAECRHSLALSLKTMADTHAAEIAAKKSETDAELSNLRQRASAQYEKSAAAYGQLAALYEQEKATVASLNQQVKTKESQLTELEQRYQSYRTSSQTTITDAEALKKQLETAQTDKNALNAALAAARASLESCRIQLATTQQSHAEADKELKKVKTEIQQLSTQMASSPIAQQQLEELGKRVEGLLQTPHLPAQVPQAARVQVAHQREMSTRLSNAWKQFIYSYISSHRDYNESICPFYYGERYIPANAHEFTNWNSFWEGVSRDKSTETAFYDLMDVSDAVIDELDSGNLIVTEDLYTMFSNIYGINNCARSEYGSIFDQRKISGKSFARHFEKYTGAPAGASMREVMRSVALGAYRVGTEIAKSIGTGIGGTVTAVASLLKQPEESGDVEKQSHLAPLTPSDTPATAAALQTMALPTSTHTMSALPAPEEEEEEEETPLVPATTTPPQTPTQTPEQGNDEQFWVRYYAGTLTDNEKGKLLAVNSAKTVQDIERSREYYELCIAPETKLGVYVKIADGKPIVGPDVYNKPPIIIMRLANTRQILESWFAKKGLKAFRATNGPYAQRIAAAIPKTVEKKCPAGLDHGVLEIAKILLNKNYTEHIAACGGRVEGFFF